MRDKRVLVADDDEAIREILCEILSTSQYEPISVSNGQEALRYLQECQSPDDYPSLILLDLMMPEMDGYNFLKAIQPRPDWVQIPVLVLSAGNPLEERVRAEFVTPFLSKPFEIDTLLNLVERMIQPHRTCRDKTML